MMSFALYSVAPTSLKHSKELPLCLVLTAKYVVASYLLYGITDHANIDLTMSPLVTTFMVSVGDGRTHCHMDAPAAPATAPV